MARKILLAEDDPAHARLIERALKEVDQECLLEVVGDGAEAIDYLFATGEYRGRDTRQTPNLILLDLKMPKMDGLQVLQVLRRVRSDQTARLPPIVVLTSSTNRTDIAEAYRLGAYSYICKPLDFGSWVGAMRQIITYWLDLNQPPTPWETPPMHDTAIAGATPP